VKEETFSERVRAKKKKASQRKESHLSLKYTIGNRRVRDNPRRSDKKKECKLALT